MLVSITRVDEYWTVASESNFFKKSPSINSLYLLVYILCDWDGKKILILKNDKNYKHLPILKSSTKKFLLHRVKI